MVKNLVKSPLIAAFYGPLILFSMALFPYSNRYLESVSGFKMSFWGYVMVLIYALWLVVAASLAFTDARAKGGVLLLFLSFSVCGLQWGVPLSGDLFLGGLSGLAHRTDLFYWLIAGSVSSILMVILVFFLQRPVPAVTPPIPAQKIYKLNIWGIIAKVLLLPVVFIVLYYAAWYLFLWQSETVRAFYGQLENRGLVAEMVEMLLERGGEAVAVLIKGVLYALFSLPLLYQMPGKRLRFMIVNAMLYFSGALLYLIPNPFIPQEIAFVHFIETGILLLVYGLISGILLHTSYYEQAPAITEPSVPASPPNARKTVRRAVPPASVKQAPAPAVKPVAQPAAPDPAKPVEKTDGTPVSEQANS